MSDVINGCKLVVRGYNDKLQILFDVNEKSLELTPSKLNKDTLKLLFGHDAQVDVIKEHIIEQAHQIGIISA